MSYLEFLSGWYNLAFLAVAAAGLAAVIAARLSGRDLFLVSAVLFATAFFGLTLNGAIHDLRLGDPGARFGTVLLVSAVLGVGTGWAAAWARNRWFAPVSGVRWNPPDRAGRTGKVVSPQVTADPASGRAQWQEESGALVVVRCHTAGDPVGFGERVRLEAFDEEEESYRVSAAEE